MSFNRATLKGLVDTAISTKPLLSASIDSTTTVCNSGKPIVKNLISNCNSSIEFSNDVSNRETNFHIANSVTNDSKDDTAKIVYLKDLNNKDIKFDMHKSSCDSTSKLYLHTGESKEENSNSNKKNGFIARGKTKREVSFYRYAKQIESCAGNMFYKVNTEGEIKLNRTWFCRVPNCPMCQWRRSLMWRGKFFKALPIIQEQYPKHRWLFLTLTIKNCELENLRETIEHLNKSFKRLSDKKRFPFEGCIKSIEVTRVYDCYDHSNNKYLGRHGTTWIKKEEFNKKIAIYTKPTSEVHPHIHICGIVKSSYFSHSYIPHKDWVYLWRDSLRVEYDPSVRIKVVKSIDFSKESDVKEAKEQVRQYAYDPLADISNYIEQQAKISLIGAICETMKYTIKEQDLIGEYCNDKEVNSEWLKEYTKQMYKLRRTEYQGVFKKIGKQIEDSLDIDNWIHNDRDDEKNSNDENNIEDIEFEWDKKLKSYVMM